MSDEPTEQSRTDADVTRREAPSVFEQQASRARARGGNPLAEFWYSLRRSGSWWMLPILLALLTVGAVLVLSGTAIAPLIYAIF